MTGLLMHQAPAMPAIDISPLSRQHRSIIANLIFFTYVLFIMEGALRKWIFPEYHHLLFMMRDPVVLAIYMLSLRMLLFPLSAFFGVWILFSVLAIAVGGLAHTISGNGVAAWVFGTRNYFLYMPLAFIMAYVFSIDDIKRFVRFNLFVALPVAILVFIQYHSSTYAFVNKGIPEDQFVTEVVEGVVRPYGIFTYTGQQVLFAGSLFAVLAIAWMLRTEFRIKLYALIFVTMAVMIIVLMTGSRAIYFVIAQIMVMILLAGIVSRYSVHRMRAWSFVALFMSGSVLLFATVLHEVLEHILERQHGAVAVEGSTLVRALGTYSSFVDVLHDAPLLGYGIGAGTPAAQAWVAHGWLPEDELGRIIAELGPVLGLCFIGLRFTFVLFLFARSWNAAVGGNPIGLVFLGFAWGIFTAGQMTFNANTNGFLAWLYAGLVLASTRQPSRLHNPR